MARTALCDKLAAAGARIGEYCGAETAAAFTDSRGEYLALRAGCGVYDLGWRVKIAVNGRDRTRWLNGMVTNNIRDLAAGRGVYSFVLNAQGHILGDLYAYNRGDSFLLGTEQAQAPKLLGLFRRYIIMDRVELADVSGQLTAVAVQGPRAADVLTKTGYEPASVELLQLKESSWQDVPVTLTRMASDDFLTYEIWAAPESIGRIWDSLVAAGAVPVGTEALEMFRVTAGIPRYGQDISERELPQETGQMQALSFIKGCYVGQEIVERIRSRGAVHRKFSGFAVEGMPPAPGTKVQRDGKDVGEITSALAVPTAKGDRTLALGYIRREAGNSGTSVSVGDATSTIEELPFRV